VGWVIVYNSAYKNNPTEERAVDGEVAKVRVVETDSAENIPLLDPCPGVGASS
jgi:hypothetical protein